MTVLQSTKTRPGADCGSDHELLINIHTHTLIYIIYENILSIHPLMDTYVVSIS